MFLRTTDFIEYTILVYATHNATCHLIHAISLLELLRPPNTRETPRVNQISRNRVLRTFQGLWAACAAFAPYPQWVQRLCCKIQRYKYACGDTVRADCVLDFWLWVFFATIWLVLGKVAKMFVRVFSFTIRIQSLFTLPKIKRHWWSQQKRGASEYANTHTHKRNMIWSRLCFVLKCF